jgi:hypothetical protein
VSGSEKRSDPPEDRDAQTFEKEPALRKKAVPVERIFRGGLLGKLTHP